MYGLDGWFWVGAGVGVKGPHGQVGNPPRVLMIYTYRTPQYQSSITTSFCTPPHMKQPSSARFYLTEVLVSVILEDHSLSMRPPLTVFNSFVSTAH